MKTFIALFLIAASTLAPAADSNREDIEITFDRHKGRIYAVYAEALKQKPGLKGRVELEFTVDRSGTATACRTRSSTFNSAVLEGKLCEQVRLMRFAPRETPFTGTKRIDFFPSA
jgi:protein TonB